MAKKADWNKIKTEYITTDISQRDLAKKYNVPYSTLRDRCKADGWYAEKKQFRSKVVADAKEQIATSKTEQLLEEYNIACAFIKMIELSVLEDNYHYAGKLDTKRVNEAANALTKFMEIKRIIKGHQTLQEQQSHEIAMRRLELEEQKVSKDKDADKEIKVVLAKEIEEWIV